MASDMYSCVICGYVIRNHHSKHRDFWDCEYRLLISGVSGPCLSGVAYYGGGSTWNPPSEYAVKRPIAGELDDTIEEIAVMKNFPANAYGHGYVMHESCWRLLEAFWGADDVPVARLLEVLRSLPLPVWMNGVIWGNHHDDLLFTEDSVEIWPWERTPFRPNSLSEYKWVAADPLYWPHADRSSRAGQESPSQWQAKSGRSDCFSVLPWEIREMIAINLTTKDALNLRLASHSYQPLLWNGAFWASRFTGGNERDFLFEKRGVKEAIDWLGLYQRTRPAACSANLRNRARIWELIRAQSHLLELRSTSGHEYISSADGRHTDWIQVSGLLNHMLSEFSNYLVIEGSTGWSVQYIDIPADLSAIGFSVIPSENLGFVTGIRFISSTGSCVCVGHMSETHESRHEVPGFMGFRLAMGKRGLKAVQVIHREGVCSEWIGYPRGSPVTDVFANCPIKRLQGYKIVQLGVRPQEVFRSSDAGTDALTLRQRELWYDGTPPQSLCLNEGSFMGNQWYSYNYLPLQWTHFGGPGGRRLRHLTGISFLCEANYDRLCGITFLYDDADTAGTGEVFQWGTPWNYKSLRKFDINGADGEYLEVLELGLWKVRYLEKGFNTLRTVKVTTNWNRSYECGKVSSQDQKHRVEAAEGTVITGFYASRTATRAMSCIGIISETVGSYSE